MAGLVGVAERQSPSRLQNNKKKDQRRDAAPPDNSYSDQSFTG